MESVRITLIGKPGCHLCDDARVVIHSSLDVLVDRGITCEFEELDILQDERLARLHSEEIPVVQIEGKRHAIWRVDPVKFVAAVEKASQRRKWGLRRG